MNTMRRSIPGVMGLTVAVLCFAAFQSTAEACWRCGKPSCQTYQTVEKTVYVPTIVPETRVVTCTEYCREVQQREVTVARCVPEVREVRQQYVVMVPQVRERERVTTVMVPTTRQVEQTYMVCVPEQVVRQGTRTVCKPVMVEETRSVCRDMGHWEQCTVERPVYRVGCFGRPRCGDCPQTVCCTRRVWVPNVVQEQVPVKVCKYETVQEPCEYTTTVYRQEKRVRNVQVCQYVPQERRCTVREVVCVPERHERVCNVTTMKRELQTVTQNCVVMVPHQVQREVQVATCKMVPKQICCRVPVSCCDAAAGK